MLTKLATPSTRRIHPSLFTILSSSKEQFSNHGTSMTNVPQSTSRWVFILILSLHYCQFACTAAHTFNMCRDAKHQGSACATPTQLAHECKIVKFCTKGYSINRGHAFIFSFIKRFTKIVVLTIETFGVHNLFVW